LTALLATDGSRRLRNFEPSRGIAEAQSRFDSFRGGKRNHDLLVLGEAAGGRVAVGIEGKADEPFGETIGEYRRGALSRATSGKPTNAPARLDGLLAAFGTLGVEPARLDDVRYQLFSAVAGTLAAAREHGADLAVFLVHEFATGRTNEERRQANARDLDKFLYQILRLSEHGPGDWIAGPTHLPGSEMIPASIPLWVGHLRTKRQ
jgi:hypothetical protein